MSAHACSEPITFSHVHDEIERLEGMAARLAGIIGAIGLLQPEHRHAEATACLVYLSEELANDLNQGMGALSVKASHLTFDQAH